MSGNERCVPARDSSGSLLREETPDGGKITYICKGKVARKGEAIEVTFRSTASKNVDGLTPVTEIPYKATLKGKVLDGTWSYKDEANNIDIEGDFKFTAPK